MKQYPVIKAATLLCFALWAIAAVAVADSYHYRNTLVGSRAASLGGAYTALSDDTDGCFYNPGGLAMATATSVSASMNAYNKSKKIYKNVLVDTGGQYQDWVQESSILLPNYFGVVKKMGAGMFGLSYAMPDSILRRQDQTFTNIQSYQADNPVEQFIINIDDSDQTYLFGPSYAFRLRENLSIGTTVYAYYRDKQIIRNQTLFFQNGEHYWSNYYEIQEDWGYRPIVGVVWEPVEKLALGITLAKTFLTSSDHRQQILLRDTTDSDFSDTNALYLNTATGSLREELPLTSTLGASYFLSPRLLFSLDCAYYEAVDGKSSVVNFALGTEYYLKDNLALRAGVFTDMANTSALTTGGTYQPEHIDIYNGSASVSLFQGPSSITIGATYGYGKGEAQMIAASTSIQDVEYQNFSLFLATAYQF
jgi:long-chain fatty acid transport protein